METKVLCICLVLHMEAEGQKERDGFSENTQGAAEGKGMGNTFYTIHKQFNQLTDFFLVWLQTICVRMCVEQYRVAIVSPPQALAR